MNERNSDTKSLSPADAYVVTHSSATSHIHGSGYGFGHEWRYHGTTHARVSYYRCAACGCEFAHNYPRVPEIGRAMYEFGVPELCESA